ncbi:MAG: NAD(P)/FAD-dependent oxidoreductase [Thermoanaerobaculia bacterium]|nr:NAD(P)/FAD-dependent oxidoreductase [Thermoanaerobaculia bacterium]
MVESATARPTQDRYDAVIAGGGPAGAAAATVLAQRGHRVLLVERTAGPTFKIGESLMPVTYWTLQRLGVLAAMKASRFPKKYSVQFYTREGRPTMPFYFHETDPHESSQTWQVLRSEFDQLLLDNAAEHGVEVCRGLGVKNVLFDDADHVRGLALDQGHEVATRAFVDATGQNALLARRLGLMSIEPHLRNASFFTHFEGAVRDPGKDEGATLVLHTEEARSWFWYIPLPDNRVSVGVVGPVDYLVTGRKGTPQEIFEQELARCPALQPRIADACQVFPMKALRDFSYKATRSAGDGWVLAGDALGFIDPIYSSGVFLALQSGEWVGDAVAEGLEAGDLSAARLSEPGTRLIEGVEAMRRLVYAFYDPDFSFSMFLKQFPEVRGELIDMLVGNVFRKPIHNVLAALSEATDRVPEAWAS